jgi:hypothetical protein
MKARRVKIEETPNAKKGTPRAFVRAKKRGACPSTARLYIVREQMYRSEFAAERIKINMQPLKIDGRI